MERKAPELLDRVFACGVCPSAWGFVASASGSTYLKFPPIIGAQGRADLLFVGINPRLTGNRPWMERLMGDKDLFAALARNVRDEEAYIRVDGVEPHYHVHARIVQEIYGADAQFEHHAAVTELFFCATANSDMLPPDGSDCADEYFEEVLGQVQPRVVICVGARVARYVRHQAAAKARLVLGIPHPGHKKILPASRERRILSAARTAKAILCGAYA